MDLLGPTRTRGVRARHLGGRLLEDRRRGPWIHPAVDPELGLVYWTFGNPYPRTDGSSRGGDNLFANSIVAIDAKTGKRRWHFQSVHHDIWDADNVMAPVLADLIVDGRKRKVVVYGSKTCWYYILDRRTGEAVHGMEERPVPQHALQKTSATQPFPGGEPFVSPYPELDKTTRPVPFYPTGGLYEVFWDRATILFPGAGGGADWGFPPSARRPDTSTSATAWSTPPTPTPAAAASTRPGPR